jgi:predicted 2-oxoglutarate/Fe(II)-dependent dioxygenase YbiX
LTPEDCRALRNEIAQASASAATVREEGREYGVDEGKRKTRWAEVSPEASGLVVDRLTQLLPEVSERLRVQVSGVQNPQFLRYREGDFFRRHRDRNPDAEAAKFARERQVSAVLFLNGESSEPAPDTYEGGALTLYGLMEDREGGSIGLPVTGEAGSLIAFPSDMVHEVTPVSRGERYTVVSWFY